MNKDVVKVERAVYNTFMLLGDTGGLFSIMILLVATILGYMNFQKIENVVVERLFVNEP